VETIQEEAFWKALDVLVAGSQIIVDRLKGSTHPRFSSGLTYPVDYGYLKGTTSMDGSGIDIWRGSLPEPTVDAIICTVDLMKKDSEMKVLLGCTPEEMKLAYEFHNQGEVMKGMLIKRKGKEIVSPSL
jgi:inorganic pyrophosphatase